MLARTETHILFEVHSKFSNTPYGASETNAATNSRFGSIKIMSFPTKSPPLSAAQQKLWKRLNQYIREAGGWIVSQPDTSPIRFEAPLNSELPDLLQEAGHNIRFMGTHERLLPQTETLREHGRSNTITRQQVGVGVANVWSLDLPSEKPVR
jgi:hypothetical protein